MSFFKCLISALIAVLLLTGCSIKTGLYKPDYNTINELKSINIAPLNVEYCSYSNNSVDNISLRGSEMVSPYGGTFADYIKKSLEEQLKSASLYDKNSNLSLSAVILNNELNANGFSTGTADISANFIVRKNKEIQYEKIHSIHHEWDSSFVGSMAIPEALRNYPIAIQKLINSLMLDKDFVNSIKTKIYI